MPYRGGQALTSSSLLRVTDPLETKRRRVVVDALRPQAPLGELVSKYVPGAAIVAGAAMGGASVISPPTQPLNI